MLRCRGDVSPDATGDLYTISAPWSVLALAFSRKVSLWVSICKRRVGRVRRRVGSGDGLPALGGRELWWPQWFHGFPTAKLQHSSHLPASPPGPLSRSSDHCGLPVYPSRNSPHMQTCVCVSREKNTYTCTYMHTYGNSIHMLCTPVLRLNTLHCPHIAPSLLAEAVCFPITADIPKCIYSLVGRYLGCSNLLLSQTMLCMKNVE